MAHFISPPNYANIDYITQYKNGNLGFTFLDKFLICWIFFITFGVLSSCTQSNTESREAVPLSQTDSQKVSQTSEFQLLMMQLTGLFGDFFQAVPTQ